MTQEVLRHVVLCADDYGLNDGVSQGVLALAEAGRISATSCMTNSPAWSRAARSLRSSGAPIGLGLHLTLTWGGPLGPIPSLTGPGGRFPPLGTLLRRALTGELSRSTARDEIRQEFERQLAAFRSEVGRPPDFVDGHQHVHVLPGIRTALLEALANQSPARRIWLRDPSDRVAAIVARRRSATKALFVGLLARGFARAARQTGFPTNQGFSGFSPFDPTRDADREMHSFLTALGPGPVVMCHPGLPDDSPDENAAARRREYDYLSSEAFADTLERRAVRLVPAPA